VAWHVGAAVTPAAGRHPTDVPPRPGATLIGDRKLRGGITDT